MATAHGPLDAELIAAPSKSVTHRALVAAALASGASTLVGPLDADDTRATRAGLEALSVRVRDDSGGWRVEGSGGRLDGGASIHVADSGTSMRFLLAAASLGRSPSRIDGSERLRQRPIGDLSRALIALGGTVRPLEGAPVEAGGAAPVGGAVRLPGTLSSQFASALLLVAPRLARGLDLRVEPPAVSLPYVELTIELMRRFGVEVVRLEELRWRVAPADYAGIAMRIEGDHSSASYFLAAAALVGGRVRVGNLDPASRQPDARFGGILERLGCVVRRGADWVEAEGSGRVPPFEVDLSDAPDLAPTMAALALVAEGPCAIRGVAHLRYKESDRLSVLAENLARLGRPASVRDDALLVAPPGGRTTAGATVVTSSDHRIAMAFAVAGLREPGIVVDDADCVSKSNPGFWRDLARIEGS